MKELCRSCGNPINRDDVDSSVTLNICTSCKDEFIVRAQTIIEEGNEKYLKYCAYCGRPFASFSYVTYPTTGNRVKRLTKRKFCDLHYSQCENCGKPIPFKSNDSHVPTTCSKECRDVVRLKKFRNTCKAKYGVEYPAQSQQVQEVRRNNCLEKYGVDNVFKLECFREKARQTCLDKYGVPVPMQSEDIKEKFRTTFKEKYGEGTKGHDELKLKRETTCLNRYGVVNPMQSAEIQERIKQSNMEKYGVPWLIQHPEVKEKFRKTSLERYGVEYPIQNEAIKQKRIHTCIERYGVPNVLQSEEIRKKCNETMIVKYGGIGYASTSIMEKIKDTCKSRYGVENPNSNNSTLKAKRKTWMEHYGVDHPMKSKELKERFRKSRIQLHASTIEDPHARQNYLKFREDPVGYIQTTFDHKPSLVEISETLGNLDPTSVSSHIPLKHHNLLGNYQSTMERDLTRFLKEVDPDVNIIIHDRKEIYPYELDIYLPDYKFAIECNPTASHNSTLNAFDPKSTPLDKNYHHDKSLRCISRGIFLMHVFGYDWSTRKPVIQSMIRNKLGCSSHKYYARNLKVVEISHKDCVSFLDTNHLQKGLTSPVRLGLLSEDGSLVSVMTFNHMRYTMGMSKSDEDGSWELSRFCNLLNTTVVGGASKLFKYFINNYNPNTVVSFSDIAHTEGKLYSILGFLEESTTAPGYVWVNFNSDSWYNRVSCQKQYLPKLLNEPDLDIVNKTETMIMSEHGFVQVFDSGKIKWVWKCSSREV